MQTTQWVSSQWQICCLLNTQTTHGIYFETCLSCGSCVSAVCSLSISFLILSVTLGGFVHLHTHRAFHCLATNGAGAEGWGALSSWIKKKRNCEVMVRRCYMYIYIYIHSIKTCTHTDVLIITHTHTHSLSLSLSNWKTMLVCKTNTSWFCLPPSPYTKTKKHHHHHPVQQRTAQSYWPKHCTS